MIDEATIVERGEQVKVWFLPWRDTWIRAKDHPDAEIDEVSSVARSTSCPPGTVWRRSIELSLPPKTPLLCRITRPLIEDLAAVEYMTKDRRGMRRHVREIWYVVSGNYRMTRHREPDTFAQARREHDMKGKTRRR